MATFNFIEGVIWILFSILIPLLFYKHSTGTERMVLFTAFVGFGISDFIEIATGAWYRPWWLLLLKGMSLTTIAACMWRIYQRVFKP